MTYERNKEELLKEAGTFGDLRVMLCMDSHLDPLLVIMIETPHPVHTHSRSSLYIYKVFEHLQQWLRVIRI